jgi:hypothetical protein
VVLVRANDGQPRFYRLCSRCALTAGFYAIRFAPVGTLNRSENDCAFEVVEAIILKWSSVD